MAKRRDVRSADHPAMQAREAVQIASDCMTAILGRQPTLVTGIRPSDEEGWIAEVEVVEDRRIPSSADILALYELEFDADGELLGYDRTHRYMRGNALSPMQDDKWTVDGDANNVGPQ